MADSPNVLKKFARGGTAGGGVLYSSPLTAWGYKRSCYQGQYEAAKPSRLKGSGLANFSFFRFFESVDYITYVTFKRRLAPKFYQLRHLRVYLIPAIVVML